MNGADRREFIRSLGLASLGFGLGLGSAHAEPTDFTGPKHFRSKMFFKISLAQWSFHAALKSGQMDNLDFPVKARKDFDIAAVDYVNVFFKDKANDHAYLNELKKRCDDNGVTSLLIMCDAEGQLADLDFTRRQQAVENHFKWVNAAKHLGCHSIRVNCAGDGPVAEVAKAGMDGLRSLCEYGKQAGMNIIVENHEGYSTNGKWLADVIKSVGLSNCGTLPDFDNFSLGNNQWYDRYQGVRELMPFAKSVSAKTKDFDDQGNCVETDYKKMLSIVKAAEYRGFLGIEYEGNKLSEEDGIRATKKLLERTAAMLD